MWISELKLHAIQSYDSANVHFSRNINVLVGPNNSGKSTVIKSIYKLQGSSGLSKENIRKGNSYGEIRVLLEDSRNWHFMVPAKTGDFELPETDRHQILLRLSEHMLPSVYYQAKYENCSPFPANLNFHLQDESGVPHLYFEFKGFRNEEPHNLIYPFLAKRKTSYYEERPDKKSSQLVSDDLRNLTSKLQQVTNPSHPEYKNYNRACKEILGFGVGLVPSTNGSGIGIYVSTHEPIPIESMGDGVANIIGLLTLIYTDRHKIFLIEELENDIHPEALKKLLKLIVEKSRENQFIVSTHSNIVVKHLGAVPGAKVFQTNCAIKNHVPTSTITEVEATPDAKRKVLEDLGYELFDSGIWEGYLILEESTAEVIINEFLIPWFAPKLIGRLRTVSANGISKVEATFDDFHRLFLFTHLEPIYKNKSWVIVDSGPQGENAIRSLKNKFKTWSESCFQILSHTDFEYYYPEQFSLDIKNVLDLNGKSQSKEKAIQKTKLVNHVKSWASTNTSQAKVEFAKSAKEVIILLRGIEQALSKKR